jgi:hypothetical protein
MTMSRSRDGCSSRLARAIACGLLLGAGATYAGPADHPGSVRIENVTVVPRDARTATVRFDVSWANSWHHEANHDAVWLFFKARAEGAMEWQHVRLAADKVLNPTGYSREEGGTPLDLIVPDGDDGFLGMFVRRADYGQGNVKAAKITAVWDLAAHKGITNDTKVDVRAFGVEMVFIPEGSFFLGSGGTEPCRFYRYTDGTQHTRPYRVTSAGAIPTGQQAGKLWARRGAQPEDGGEIPAAFPNGYAALYCMKKHITKGQYAAFLNTLPPAEAMERYPDRAGIARPSAAPNNTYTTGNDRHHNCGGLSWADGAAWAAWAGLRPMTELEYEKICRGPMEPGWDTGDKLDHPSYWEVQDINGWRLPRERPVTVGNATGRRFKGTHGPGTPTLPADWPHEDAVGAGIRGGYGAAGRPSNRLHAARVVPERAAGYAWRGVRTAPKGIGN